MRIVCPACAAAYEVPDSRLAPGRIVRCVKCGEQWAPVAAAEVLPPQHWPEAEPEPQEPVYPTLEADTPRFTAMDRLAMSRRSIGPNPIWLRLAWVASVALVLLVLAGFFVWRSEVAEAWPPSTRVYNALGLMQPGGKP